MPKWGHAFKTNNKFLCRGLEAGWWPKRKKPGTKLQQYHQVFVITYYHVSSQYSLWYRGYVNCTFAFSVSWRVFSCKPVVKYSPPGLKPSALEWNSQNAGYWKGSETMQGSKWRWRIYPVGKSLKLREWTVQRLRKSLTLTRFIKPLPCSQSIEKQ